jgi:hypothetical protein
MGHTGTVKDAATDKTSRWSVALVVVAFGVYAWVAAGLRPFTVGEEVMVALPALLVFAGACWPRPATKRPVVIRSTRGSTAAWLALVGLALGWELFAYFSSPRQQHPTLSVIADEVMSVHPGRAAVFLAWLSLGGLLISRRHVLPQ